MSANNFNNIERAIVRQLDKWEKEEKKKMKDKMTSYIRTYAPMVGGALLSWLATFGLVVDDEVRSAVIIIVTAVLQGLYYALARLVGKKYPAIEKWLLGSSKQPTYEE